MTSRAQRPMVVPKEIIQAAHRFAGEVAEFAFRESNGADGSSESAGAGDTPLRAGDAPLSEFDRRITDEDLRASTRSRFVSGHYADAVETGVKALCDCVRSKSGYNDDGDSLMTTVFSQKNPLLRINALRSQSEQSAQRGHMLLCQGVVAGWRNPRAHSLVDDSAERAMMMLETIQELIVVTKQSTRTRKRRRSATS